VQELPQVLRPRRPVVDGDDGIGGQDEPPVLALQVGDDQFAVFEVQPDDLAADLLGGGLLCPDRGRGQQGNDQGVRAHGNTSPSAGARCQLARRVPMTIRSHCSSAAKRSI
jgi:hypothetical protein